MNPILINFPEKIETERLYIRPCLPGDGETVSHAIRASLPSLKKWLAFAHKPQSAEDTEINIREAHAQFLLRENFRLHIFLKENDEFVGSTGLHRVDWDVRKFEIGYWIDSRHTKKGYITEAVQALSTFAFEKLEANRVEIRCDVDNLESRRIPEKLGFALEGTLRKNSLSTDGSSLRDICVFAKIKED